MSIPALRALEIIPIDGVFPSIFSNGHASPGHGKTLTKYSPIDRASLGRFNLAHPDQVNQVIARAAEAFLAWRTVPAPERGQLVKRIGELVAANKKILAELITLEAGKTVQEAQGEVQEWIDMCDFAVGLSRQLHGLTIASERPDHRMMEQWHPLGPIAVVTAFNFPMAVWAWNAMLALVCGNSVVWKPSEKTPLCALACQSIFNQAAHALSAPEHLSNMVLGQADTGIQLAESPAFPLVSATGSVRMGRDVARRVGARLGRSLLELGGNNAMIVTPNADINLALRAIVFSAVGTTGQRCTTLRRLIVHRNIKEALLARLEKAYASLRIGDPRDTDTLVGPLIDESAYQQMQTALGAAERDGGRRRFGGHRVTDKMPDHGFYVAPAIVEMPVQTPVVQEETFAPILYVLSYDNLSEAIRLQNAVPQGLSSAIFTDNVREAEYFLSAQGSDCGIANVNIGTSGAEIGGAFGGEKDTGGGRESGSDAWKNYMRRATNTINYGQDLPLAQGIRFD